MTLVVRSKLGDPDRSVRHRPRIDRSGPRTVLWLRGDQDIVTVPGLLNVLVEAMAADGTDLLVDLSEATFLSSDTVAAFVWARQELRERARTLSLQAPTAANRRLLGACGVMDLLDGGPSG